MFVSKPTILLVHGAYHTAAAWERVIPYLQAKDYRCLAPQMCFCRTETPISSWQECIDQIQDIIKQETGTGRDIILVNHSLGGIPGCSAIKGFSDASHTRGRVIGIIQVTALTFLNGAHLAEFYRGISVSTPHNMSGWKHPPADAKETFYNDLDPQDAEYWTSKLIPNSAQLDSNQDGVYAGFKDVPIWYILCTKDLRLLPKLQGEFVATIKNVNSEVTVREMHASHSPMLSRPEETAGIIVEAAIAFAASI